MIEDNKINDNIAPTVDNIITNPEQIEYILKNKNKIKSEKNDLDKNINNYVNELTTKETNQIIEEVTKPIAKTIDNNIFNKKRQIVEEMPNKEIIQNANNISKSTNTINEETNINEPTNTVDEETNINEPTNIVNETIPVEPTNIVNETIPVESTNNINKETNINEPTNVINTTVTPVAPIINNDEIEMLDEEEPQPVQKVFARDESNFRKDYIIFENVRKEYKNESLSTIALDDISFKIDEGELVIFLGQSGAGKSTALNMLGGMDSVTSGRIIVGDKEITNYDFDELTEYRRKDIGFIFQFYNLIPNLSAKENIELSTEITTDSIDANLILERVGLKEGIDKFPSQLSGGEQQRVAIARAIAKKPKLLLCDEPTGALDYKTGKQILKLLQETCRNNKITTIIITHNQAITPMADKVIYFNSGKVVDVKINKYPVDIEGIEW